jgi:hypothetical protein
MSLPVKPAKTPRPKPRPADSKKATPVSTPRKKQSRSSSVNTADMLTREYARLQKQGLSEKEIISKLRKMR